MAQDTMCFNFISGQTNCSCSGSLPDLPDPPPMLRTPTSTTTVDTPATLIKNGTTSSMPTDDSGSSATEPTTGTVTLPPDRTVTTGTSTLKTGAVIGIACGVAIAGVILVLIIVWLIKKGKVPCKKGEDSCEQLPDNQHKSVELTNVKKGTLILTPSPPPLPPESDNPPPLKTENPAPPPGSNGLPPVEEENKVPPANALGPPTRLAPLDGAEKTSTTSLRRLKPLRNNKVSPEGSVPPLRGKSPPPNKEL